MDYLIVLFVSVAVIDNNKINYICILMLIVFGQSEGLRIDKNIERLD